MSASQGRCTKCNEINTYKATACVLCGARLPWASTAVRAAALAAPATAVPETPSVQSEGLSAFFASSAYRYVVLAVLLFGAAAAIFVVNNMASRQLDEAMSAPRAPIASRGMVSAGKAFYPK
jgi:hypothetical protein